MEKLAESALRVLALTSRSSGRPFETGTPQQARIDYDANCPTLQGAREAVASVEDLGIAGPNGPITLRIYRGIGAPLKHGPGLIYLHGGGWVIGNLESHDEICRWFANTAKCTVICPDYRLAPEHKFPAGVTDCAATLAFVVKSAADLGIDPGRIAVAGDSAGGNLAAVLALMSRNGDAPPLAAQLLIYPNTDAAQTADSYRRYAEGFGLTASTMRWFRDHYVRTAADIADWRVSPLQAETLAGVAPAFVATAGHDILVDEGIAYAGRLREEGVRTVHRHWPGQIHGFVSMGRYVAEARRAVEEAVAAWRGFEAVLI
ncbi:alpha/beta hydrolase [Rhizobium sp. CNPSo 4039]|uniref:alpha/beta hydrolase n=1 Tax=Rhizobium sp. CNPSo 4039 TaxID=3021409 RepID=UPI000DDD01FE|nr:alpha/beta hydrolase [Rhizobium sp. CNPSo 4039]MDK4716845.1 alpha/beta hydrolase [Rhizobium sp. CNPSo 4039]